MPKKELTIDNLRPEIREQLRVAMLAAIDRLAFVVVENMTHYLFSLAVNGKGPFTVDHVWRNLPTNTRDHFVNHALDAIDTINAELGPGRKPKPAAPQAPAPGPAISATSTKPAAPAAGYREHEDSPPPKAPAAPITPPAPVFPATQPKKKHHR